MKKSSAEKIKSEIYEKLGINIIPVGRIETGSGLYLEKDGQMHKISLSGYEHFK